MRPIYLFDAGRLCSSISITIIYLQLIILSKSNKIENNLSSDLCGFYEIYSNARLIISKNGNLAEGKFYDLKIDKSKKQMS
jgi:hypothetical protein